MSPKPDEAPRVQLEAVMVTDVGVVRDHNEDAAYVDPEGAFFIVADGMGGHAAGEVASAMAVETVRKALEGARKQIGAFAMKPTELARRDLVGLLQSSVLAAHQAVFQRGQKETDKQGMGTTLDVVLIAGGEAFIAHVGDSRTYLVRDGRASQITTDHTVAEVLVIEGKLSIEEAQVSPLRTILVNAIGVSADVGVEMAHLQLKRDDRLLVCSDGLHDYFLAEEEIAERIVAGNGKDLRPALQDMVTTAKERGGHDNITGIAVHVIELPDAVPSAIEPDETQPVDVGVPPKPAPAGWTDDERTENANPVLDIETAPTIPPTVRPAAVQRQTQPLRVVKPLADEARRAEASRADTIPPELTRPKDGKDDKKPEKPEKPEKKKSGKSKGKGRSSRTSKPPGDKKKPAADADEDETTQERSPIDDK
jgi:serine/threonine protein phosphatase PrpC